MKTTRFFQLLFIIIFICIMPLQAQKMAVHAGKLVDPATGKVQSDVAIVFEEGVIQSIKKATDLSDDIKVIDLSEKVVLPGLVDAHTHLCDAFDAKGDVGNQLLVYSLVATTADRALEGIRTSRSMMKAGFTTIRDMGNAGNYGDVALRRAIEKGIIHGPTLQVSGKIIAPFGGQFILDPENPDIGRHDYIYADTQDELRRAIREVIHFGADWVKIIMDDYPYIYSVEDVRFIVEESAAAGKGVAAHAVTENGARNAILGGVTSIEHGFEMSDEVLQLAKEKGVVLCATDFTPEIRHEYQFFSTPYEVVIDRLKRAHKIGVTLAFGSDVISNIPGHNRGTASMSLIESWQQAGIPAKDILRSMTIIPAKLMGLEKERGQIKKGMAADLIAVDKNPLDDILALKSVQFVMKDGKIIKHPKNFHIR